MGTGAAVQAEMLGSSLKDMGPEEERSKPMLPKSREEKEQQAAALSAMGGAGAAALVEVLRCGEESVVCTGDIGVAWGMCDCGINPIVIDPGHKGKELTVCRWAVLIAIDAVDVSFCLTLEKLRKKLAELASTGIPYTLTFDRDSDDQVSGLQVQ
jgi:hypothetical protein